MPALKTIRMTLTGALKGKTKLLNRHQFIKGVAVFTGTDIQVEGVAKYFTRSYQVKVTTGKPKVEEPVVVKVVSEPSLPISESEILKHMEPEPDNEAIRVDDSDVISDKEIEAKEDAPEEPNPRQADIIAAVNGIEKTEWVDQNAKTPRPRVKDVSVLMEDPTVTKIEIIEVIEKWLS